MLVIGTLSLDQRRQREEHPHLQGHARAIIARSYEYLIAHDQNRGVMARALGAEISVLSDGNKGSAFILELPELR